MSRKMYCAFGALAIVCFVALQIYLHIDFANFKDDITGPPKIETETEQSKGHDHTEGTFHEGAHEDPIPGVEVSPEPKVQYTAPDGAVLKPDFPVADPTEDPVKAASTRLEYIKNNPYAWGGVHSERATELIAELMPPRMSRDHADGDERQDLLAELTDQNDPRTGEVLIANMCEGSVGGTWLTDELVNIGPPAVPHILPYLEKGMEQGGYIRYSVFDSLARIGVRYRDNLGGIVDHIIIPKFETILADEDFEHYGETTVRYAREALEQLQ